MNRRLDARIKRAIAFVALLVAIARPAEATTFTVTNANDSGSGSLRAAIDLTNADATATSGSPHSIGFSGTIGVIRLSSALPLIANHVTIDGGTLNAVIIDGSGAYRGFFIDTGTVTLRNLVIYDTKAKGGDGVAGGGGGGGLGGAVFVNQATAAVTLDTVAISTSNVTGGAGGLSPSLFVAGGGGGGLAFNGGSGSSSTSYHGGGGGGGGLLGAGTDGNATTGVGGAGGAGGGGGGGGLPHGGDAGSQVTSNAAPERGLNRGEGVYVNGTPPAAGGAGGFGGGGGGGVVERTQCCAVGPGPGGYAAGGGAGGFGGGGGGVHALSGVSGGAGGFGGGGGGGTTGGVGGTGGGSGGSTTDGNARTGGGGAAFGPAAFVNLGSLTVINSTVLNLSATAGTTTVANGATAGTADATAIYNRAGTVTGTFASGTPQSGYWWYAVETGRGYAIEIAGGRVFMTFYFYAADGTAKWWITTAAMTDSAHYWGPVYEFTGGQQLNGAYQVPNGPAAQSSNAFIAFTGPTTATMSWADGTIPLTRFDIVGGGVAAGPAAGSPQTGWYWNSGESGRGWFVEVQNSTLFLSGFMYDARGEPTWYTSQGAMTTTSLYSGDLLLFAGGKAIGGTNQSPGPGTSQGTVTLQFPTTTTAILTLPGGGTVTLTRFSF